MEYITIICVISGSVSFDWFFSSLWLVFSYLFACLIIFYLMTDTMNFTLLDADFWGVVFKYCCVYSEMLLSYLEIVWFFQGLLLALLGKIRDVCILELNWPHYWGRVVVPLWLLGIELFLTLYIYWELFCCFYPVVLSLVYGFLTPMCRSVFNWRLKGSPL